MRLPTELLLLSVSILQTTATPIDPSPRNLHRRGASFHSLRGLTSLSHDYSPAESYSHPAKFFHESTFSPHYDGRFAEKELSHSTRTYHLRLLVKSYMDTMQRIGVRTWLMHGCLLGWWWNSRIMPWDTDIDTMVDETGIKELGSWWNMSVHHFAAHELRLPDLPLSKGQDEDARLASRLLHEEIAAHGKKYLLEVNPYYMNMSTRDRENVIDARWIDTATGLFIDITTIHVQPVVVSPATAETEDEEQDDEDLGLYTKDQHAYSYSQIFPLRRSTFEGILVHVPYSYEQVLLDEYGYRSITHKWFRGWQFDEERHEWTSTPEAEQVPSASEQQKHHANKATLMHMSTHD